MKNSILLLVILWSTALSFGQNDSKQKTVNILPQSQLMISGDTNISDFRCDFDAKMLPSNCAVTYSKSGNGYTFRNASLVLDNLGFDCGNRQINKDFHALLQTEKYPSIGLELKRISMNASNVAMAQVVIHIAGEKNEYEVPVTVLTNPATCFEGKLKLDINDFGLKPPKKAFGLIKVREDIEISFNLTVEK